MESSGITAQNVSRRRFLQESAAVTASAAALAAIGCVPAASAEEAAEHMLPTNEEADGKWVSAACWHNCGGRCMNKVMVKDGVVIRQKTDDTHDDSYDFPQQRGCVRGKAQQQQCFGADRILYPLKRKGWMPGGGEIKRIMDELGPTGFYSKTGITWMNALGGIITSWETQSMGTYSFETTMMGMPGRDMGNANDRFDMLNAEYVVMLASNPNWSAAGTPTNWWLAARDAGAKFYCIDPLYNATAQALDATWLPATMAPMTCPRCT